MAYFPLWRITALLCGRGLRDEALLFVVGSIPFSSPSDREIAAISEGGAENCILALDENVLWCRVSVPQGQRIIRMLRSGELALCVHTFEPNNSKVLAGAKARLLSADAAPMCGLDTARQQPPAGFLTPHHVRASLKLGPRADVSELRQILADLPGVHFPA